MKNIQKAIDKGGEFRVRACAVGTGEYRASMLWKNRRFRVEAVAFKTVKETVAHLESIMPQVMEKQGI